MPKKINNVFLCFAVFVLLATGCNTITCTIIQGEGEYIGTVIQLAKEGQFAFTKTWEGEMVRGGIQNGSGGFSVAPLFFTVNDDNLRMKVQDALDGQYEVQIKYVEYWGPMPFASANGKNLFLTDIKRR